MTKLNKRAPSAKFICVVAGAASSLLMTSMAHAEQRIKVRCAEDALESPQAIERNSWARKCDYLDADEEAFYNARGIYITFSNIAAPWDRNAACIGGGQTLGMCKVAGCYTPGQRMMFRGKYLPIETAKEQGIASVTALSDDWSIGDFLPFVEEPIGSYVVGDELRDVLTIVTENGHRVEVTQNHPMVDHDGNIVVAETVKAGETRLLTTEGESLVREVTARPYQGLVWNVEPESMRTRANILVAEGFIMGSVRYQNDWAEETSRLHLRRHIDASAF